MERTGTVCMRFFECDRLGCVTIQNGIVEIGREAFRHCGNLVKVEMPGSDNKTSLLFSLTPGHTLNIIEVQK